MGRKRQLLAIAAVLVAAVALLPGQERAAGYAGANPSRGWLSVRRLSQLDLNQNGNVSTATSLSTNSNTSGATLALTGVTVPAGAAVVVCVGEFNTQTTGSVADSVNGSYTLVKSQSDANAPAYVAAFVLPNSAALSSATITLTKGLSGSHAAISAFYATYIASSGAVDSAVTAGTSSASSDPPTISLTSGSPSQANDLLAACTGGQINGGALTFTQDTTNGWSAPPAFVESGTSNSDLWLAGGYLVNTGTGTKTFNPSVSAGTGNRVADTLIIGLKHQ